MTDCRNRTRAERLRQGARRGLRVLGTGLALAVSAGPAPGVAWAAEADGAAGAGDQAAVRLTYGPIGPYDTLWSIARRVRPGTASTTQTMAALVRLNPDAFIEGDMNRIRGGEILQLPTEAEALGAAPTEAAGRSARDVATARLGAEAARADPVAPPEPVIDGVSQRLAEALADRDRLAEENTGLAFELERARTTAARAEEETVALRRAVAVLEREVAALEERLAAALARQRTAAPDGEVPFALVAWGVIGVLVLGAAGGVLYRRRRARASGAVAAVVEVAEADDAFEEPVAAPAESAPARAVAPAPESYQASGESREPAEPLPPEDSHDPPEPDPPPPEPDPPPVESYAPAAADAAPAEEEVAPGTVGPSGYSPNTKLNLARAYVNMGDEETAREVLEEVLAEGDGAQRAAAQELLDEL